MAFDRADTINFIMSHYEDIAEADLEEKWAELNKLSDYELHMEAESLRNELERDADIDWREGAIEDATEGHC